MAEPGFIRGELDTKLLILYITARLTEPVPFDTVLDLAMCDDGVQYFEFSECLQDLVKKKNLTLSKDGLYSITEKGMRNGEIGESSLPYSVRLRCDKNVEACNRKLRRKRQVRTTCTQRPNGTYTVRLVLDDDLGNLMDLKLMAVQKDMADHLSMRFSAAPEGIYNEIMNLLLSELPEESRES